MSTTPQHPSIRPYQADDAISTLRIFTTAITRTAAADYSPEQVQAWAQPGQRDAAGWHLAMRKRNSFVATANGEVVGFSDVDEHGYIDMMFVDPQHQRQGVARALLEEAERQARELHATSLTANVSITARPFFERHRFFIEHRQEPVKQGVKLVNYRMRKLLNEEHI
ncbi:GNAT family N-acetyltransferase [Microbacterium sp. NPDC076768]|uniref:GNAT family N-acetyltransferase n=1 Tax=Microbacterium sp. NPDC076768 TaxID=3154858 RepID=UPI00343C764F